MQWSHFRYIEQQVFDEDGYVDLEFNLWGAANKTVALAAADRPSDWDGIVKPGDFRHHDTSHSRSVHCRFWTSEPQWKSIVFILWTMQQALDKLSKDVEEPNSNQILIAWGTNISIVMIAQCLQLEIRPPPEPLQMLDHRWGDDDLRLFPGKASDGRGRNLLPFVNWPEGLERPWEQ